MENLNLMTDEELAIMYVDGDNKAFDLLLSRNQEKLFTYILFVVRDREMANDMFQETFFKVVSRLQQGKYIANGKFSAWLMRIAHNVIMDWYRQQRAQNIVDAPKENDLSNVGSTLLESSREGELVNNQVMEDVRRMMSHLPASQREVVFMRFYQQMSFKEIAEATGGQHQHGPRTDALCHPQSSPHDARAPAHAADGVAFLLLRAVIIEKIV